MLPCATKKHAVKDCKNRVVFFQTFQYSTVCRVFFIQEKEKGRTLPPALLVQEPASTNFYPFLSKGLKCHLSSPTPAHFKQLGQLISLWAIWPYVIPPEIDLAICRALTMTCAKVDFQGYIYEKPSAPFESS